MERQNTDQKVQGIFNEIERHINQLRNLSTKASQLSIAENASYQTPGYDSGHMDHRRELQTIQNEMNGLQSKIEEMFGELLLLAAQLDLRAQNWRSDSRNYQVAGGHLYQGGSKDPAKQMNVASNEASRQAKSSAKKAAEIRNWVAVIRNSLSKIDYGPSQIGFTHIAPGSSLTYKGGQGYARLDDKLLSYASQTRKSGLDRGIYPSCSQPAMNGLLDIVSEKTMREFSFGSYELPRGLEEVLVGSSTYQPGLYITTPRKNSDQSFAEYGGLLGYLRR